MHAEVEGDHRDGGAGTPAGAAFAAVIAQVVVIDLVFSIDSIVTAIGMAQDVRIMIAAILVAVAVMFVASGPVAAFISAHPTTKVLALSFLVLIGVALVADGFDFHVPRGYIYFAMAFAGVVEAINIKAQRRRRGVNRDNSDRISRLHQLPFCWSPARAEASARPRRGLPASAASTSR